jgi:multidrug resistance efflux pump
MAGVGLSALVAACAAGYVYWDSASHFESTDDAFITARQFAIAPKIAGYVTAVPVTDNQHVNKGDAVAKIDQRDYLTALAQAQAQVAGAEEHDWLVLENGRVVQGFATSTNRSSSRVGRRLSRAQPTSRLSRPSSPL